MGQCVLCDTIVAERQYHLWKSEFTKSSFCSRCGHEKSSQRYISYWGTPSYQPGSWRKRYNAGRSNDIDLTPLVEVLARIDNLDTSIGRKTEGGILAGKKNPLNFSDKINANVNNNDQCTGSRNCKLNANDNNNTDFKRYNEQDKNLCNDDEKAENEDTVLSKRIYNSQEESNTSKSICTDSEREQTFSEIGSSKRCYASVSETSDSASLTEVSVPSVRQEMEEETKLKNSESAYEDFMAGLNSETAFQRRSTTEADLNRPDNKPKNEANGIVPCGTGEKVVLDLVNYNRRIVSEGIRKFGNNVVSRPQSVKKSPEDKRITDRENQTLDKDNLRNYFKEEKATKDKGKHNTDLAVKKNATAKNNTTPISNTKFEEKNEGNCDVDGDREAKFYAIRERIENSSQNCPLSVSTNECLTLPNVSRGHFRSAYLQAANNLLKVDKSDADNTCLRSRNGDQGQRTVHSKDESLMKEYTQSANAKCGTDTQEIKSRSENMTRYNEETDNEDRIKSTNGNGNLNITGCHDVDTVHSNDNSKAVSPEHLYNDTNNNEEDRSSLSISEPDFDWSVEKPNVNCNTVAKVNRLEKPVEQNSSCEEKQSESDSIDSLVSHKKKKSRKFSIYEDNEDEFPTEDSTIDIDESSKEEKELGWRTRGYNLDFFMSRQSVTGGEILDRYHRALSGRRSRNNRRLRGRNGNDCRKPKTSPFPTAKKVASQSVYKEQATNMEPGPSEIKSALDRAELCSVRTSQRLLKELGEKYL